MLTALPFIVPKSTCKDILPVAPLSSQAATPFLTPPDSLSVPDNVYKYRVVQPARDVSTAKDVGFLRAVRSAYARVADHVQCQESTSVLCRRLTLSSVDRLYRCRGSRFNRRYPAHAGLKSPCTIYVWLAAPGSDRCSLMITDAGYEYAAGTTGVRKRY